MEMASETDYVSSLSWAGNGKYLAIGGSNADIQLWDVEKERRVRVMNGHSDRVGALTWNSHTLTRWDHEMLHTLQFSPIGIGGGCVFSCCLSVVNQMETNR